MLGGRLGSALVVEDDWFALDREHYRAGFVSAAVRTGQHLLARGDSDHAQAVARQAPESDPRAETAYVVLVDAALARGDRSAAHRLLQRCIDALRDLGVPTSTTTASLQERLHPG